MRATVSLLLPQHPSRCAPWRRSRWTRPSTAAQTTIGRRRCCSSSSLASSSRSRCLRRPTCELKRRCGPCWVLHMGAVPWLVQGLSGLSQPRRAATYRRCAPGPSVCSCTFARVALVPLFVLLWHTQHSYAPIATASVFILAALTDWLDGYLARRVRGFPNARTISPTFFATRLFQLPACLPACALACAWALPMQCVCRPARFAVVLCPAAQEGDHLALFPHSSKPPTSSRKSNKNQSRKPQNGLLQMKITSAFGAFLDPVADKIMWAGPGGATATAQQRWRAREGGLGQRALLPSVRHAVALCARGGGPACLPLAPWLVAALRQATPSSHPPQALPAGCPPRWCCWPPARPRPSAAWAWRYPCAW